MSIEYVLFGILGLAVLAAYVTFIVIILRQINRQLALPQQATERALWTVIVILFPFAGTLAWLLRSRILPGAGGAGR